MANGFKVVNHAPDGVHHIAIRPTYEEARQVIEDFCACNIRGIEMKADWTAKNVAMSCMGDRLSIEEVNMGIECPNCGATERHPTDANIVQIRANKVYDAQGRCWSQCLVCSGGYDEIGGSWKGGYHNEDKGWFPTY